MHVTVSSNILNAVYEKYTEKDYYLSHLFGITTDREDSLDVIILFSTEFDDKFDNQHLNTFLPSGINYLGVLIRQFSSTWLESVFDSLNKFNFTYLLTFDNSQESQIINLYTKKESQFNKIDAKFNVLGPDFDVLKAFGLSLSKYSLCLQGSIEFGDLEEGLIVPEPSLVSNLCSFLKSQDVDKISLINEDIKNPINIFNVIKISEEEDFNTIFLFQFLLITKLNDDINIIKNNLKSKFTEFINNMQSTDLLCAVSQVEVQKNVKEENTSTGKKTRGKGAPLRDYGKSNRKDTKDNRIILAKKVSSYSQYTSSSIELDVFFDSSTCELCTNLASDLKEGTETKKLLSLVFAESCLKSLGEGAQSLSFTVPYYQLLSGKLTTFLGYNIYKQPYLIKPYDPRLLIPQNVFINPHAKMDRPAWVSPKNSVVSTISGRFAYFHYCVDDINDSGWGCCYRSLQMVWSWYLLQNYTNLGVPDHWTIQQILNENDTGGNTIKIGSKTWIGTVESSYIINWRLNMLCKIHYLGDSSYLPDYSSVISEHFKLQKTPIIIAAGLYAYVILGICVDNDNEATYLIADPHYTGADNIKSISAKGVCWRRSDFLNMATESGFINLLLPQTELYKN